MASATAVSLRNLATETRLQIYSYLLTFEEPIYHVTDSSKFATIATRHESHHRLDTSILEVNKATFKEAVSILYELNNLVVEHLDICELVPVGNNAIHGLSRIKRMILVDSDRAWQDVSWLFCRSCKFGKEGFLEKLLSRVRLKPLLAQAFHLIFT